MTASTSTPPTTPLTDAQKEEERRRKEEEKKWEQIDLMRARGMLGEFRKYERIGEAQDEKEREEEEENRARTKPLGAGAIASGLIQSEEAMRTMHRGEGLYEPLKKNEKGSYDHMINVRKDGWTSALGPKKGSLDAQLDFHLANGQTNVVLGFEFPPGKQSERYITGRGLRAALATYEKKGVAPVYDEETTKQWILKAQADYAKKPKWLQKGSRYYKDGGPAKYYERRRKELEDNAKLKGDNTLAKAYSRTKFDNLSKQLEQDKDKTLANQYPDADTADKRIDAMRKALYNDKTGVPLSEKKKLDAITSELAKIDERLKKVENARKALKESADSADLYKNNHARLAGKKVDELRKLSKEERTKLFDQTSEQLSDLESRRAALRKDLADMKGKIPPPLLVRPGSPAGAKPSRSAADQNLYDGIKQQQTVAKNLQSRISSVNTDAVKMAHADPAGRAFRDTMKTVFDGLEGKLKGTKKLTTEFPGSADPKDDLRKQLFETGGAPKPVGDQIKALDDQVKKITKGLNKLQAAGITFRDHTNDIKDVLNKKPKRARFLNKVRKKAAKSRKHLVTELKSEQKDLEDRVLVLKNQLGNIRALLPPPPGATAADKAQIKQFEALEKQVSNMDDALVAEKKGNTATASASRKLDKLLRKKVEEKKKKQAAKMGV